MGSNIIIAFKAESSEVTDASKEVQDSLRDIDTVMREVEQSGQDLATGLISDFLESERAAGRSASEIERTLVQSYNVPADAAREMAQISTRSLDDVRQASTRVADAQDEVANGFRAKATRAVEEFAATADDSLADVGNQLLSLAGFAGGIGGVVTGLVQGGIDLVTTAIQDQQDAARQLQEDLVNAYKAASDAGRSYLDDTQVFAAAQDIYFDNGPGGRMEQYRAAAERIGVDVQTYVLAQAGSYEDLKTVIEAARKAEEDRVAQLGTGKQVIGDEEYQQLNRILTINEQLRDQHLANQQAAAATEQLRSDLAQRAIADTQRQREVIQALRDDSAAPIVATVTVDESALNSALRKPRVIEVSIDAITKFGERIRV